MKQVLEEMKQELQSFIPCTAAEADHLVRLIQSEGIEHFYQNLEQYDLSQAQFERLELLRGIFYLQGHDVYNKEMLQDIERILMVLAERSFQAGSH